MKSELPNECYGVLNPEQHIIRIKKGESGFYKMSQPQLVEGDTIEDYVNEFNATNGISKAQRAAMEHGSMFGWDGEMAKPESYDGNRKLLPPKLPIRISANEHDFYVTMDWIRRNQEKGNGVFHLPGNGDLYPFLHIETNENAYHSEFEKCFELLKKYPTVYQAIDDIDDLEEFLSEELLVGSGGSHIYFQEAPTFDFAVKRLGIIYFDPYL